MTPTEVGVYVLLTIIFIFAVYCTGWMLLDLSRRAMRRIRDLAG